MTQRLNITNVALAPDSPGIYVWYSVVSIGSLDWRAEIREGEDVGGVRLRKLLQDYSLQFEKQDLNVLAKAHFSTKWEGNLRHDTKDSFEFFLTWESMQRVLGEERKRKVLASILGDHLPVYATPLYIGVADSLRARLRQHADEFLDLLERASKDTSLRHAFQKEENFAQRAFKMGFQTENLDVFFEDFSSRMSGWSSEDVRDVTEAAERILNRWGTPTLGRK